MTRNITLEIVHQFLPDSTTFQTFHRIFIDYFNRDYWNCGSNYHNGNITISIILDSLLSSISAPYEGGFLRDHSRMEIVGTSNCDTT